MRELTASQTRIPPDAFNQVVYQGERIHIRRKGGPGVFLISEEDLTLLEQLEDQTDTNLALQALSNMQEKGEKPVSWKEAKQKLGL